MSDEVTGTLPEPEEIEALYRELVTQEPPLLAKRYIKDYRPLLPSDVLYGASPIDKLSDWYQSDFKPAMDRLGDEGTRVWESLKKPELLLNPKVLSSLFTVIARVYFPKYVNDTAVVALIVVIQQLVKEDMKREGQKDNGRP